MTTMINGLTQIKASSIPQAQLNLANPVNPQDAVTLSYLQALPVTREVKYACRVATQTVGDVPFSSFASNTITTSTSVSTINGITLAVGDRILVKNYTGANAPYNGIYTYTSLTGTSQFTRATDASTSGTGTSTDLNIGAIVPVEDGTVAAGTLYMVTPSTVGTDTITLNTSAINFSLITGANVNGTPVDNEIPGGTPNGSLTTFTLANTPITGSVKLFMNGVRQYPTTDYTVSGTTITMVAAPAATDTLLADYRR